MKCHAPIEIERKTSSDGSSKFNISKHSLCMLDDVDDCRFSNQYETKNHEMISSYRFLERERESARGPHDHC